MTIKLQIVAAAILLLGLIYLINMICKRKIELKYALLWMLSILSMLVVDLFPPILSILSYLFGIATPVNTLFLLGFVFALILIFALTVAVSRLAERVRKLSQAAAISEEKIKQLEDKINLNEGDRT